MNMTGKEKNKFLKLLYENKTLSRKQLSLTFKDRTDHIILALSNKGYIILCNPVNLKGIIQKSDDNIFRLSDIAVDYIKEVIDREKEKRSNYIWRAIPIGLSLASLIISFLSLLS